MFTGSVGPCGLQLWQCGAMQPVAVSPVPVEWSTALVVTVASGHTCAFCSTGHTTLERSSYELTELERLERWLATASMYSLLAIIRTENFGSGVRCYRESDLSKAILNKGKQSEFVRKSPKPASPNY